MLPGAGYGPIPIPFLGAQYMPANGQSGAGGPGLTRPVTLQNVLDKAGPACYYGAETAWRGRGRPVLFRAIFFWTSADRCAIVTTIDCAGDCLGKVPGTRRRMATSDTGHGTDCSQNRVALWNGDGIGSAS